MMKQEPARLWDKGTPLDELVHRFTVGDDPTWDRYLVHWDCLGSAAHAQTLAKIDLLNAAELKTLLTGLTEIDTLDRAGQFTIPSALEDCHTAIENFLTEKHGPVGGKIHAGRSRNDQIATAMRLFMRHHALGWLDLLSDFIEAALKRINHDGDVSMPGYTHMQPAMPSSVGLWLHAYVEAALEQIHATFDLLQRLDSSPLGTGAGLGVPLPLDREYTASLLGFSRAQRNPIDTQNSRGRLEKYFVRVAADVGAFLEKLANDFVLFTTAEFGFFTLPETMTTGSSIMPQKRNPDVMELLRARGARLRARETELIAVAGKLTSSYHRDLQLTKEPAIRAALELGDMLQVAARVVGGFTIHSDHLTAAMRPELYATHAALVLVQAGTPFREAYRRVADDVRAGRWQNWDLAAWRATDGKLPPDALAAAQDEWHVLQTRADAVRTKIETAETSLLPPLK